MQSCDTESTAGMDALAPPPNHLDVHLVLWKNRARIDEYSAFLARNGPPKGKF